MFRYWNAFQKLGTCRQMGMTSYGPIPWTAINEYALRYSYYGADFDRLEHYIGVLDGVYLAHKPTGGNKN